MRRSLRVGHLLNLLGRIACMYIARNNGSLLPQMVPVSLPAFAGMRDVLAFLVLVEVLILLDLVRFSLHDWRSKVELDLLGGTVSRGLWGLRRH